MEQQKDRRLHNDAFSYFLVIMLALIFFAILGAMVFKSNLPAQPQAALSNWGSLLLGMVGIAVGFQWGSSRSSQFKDQMGAAQKPLEINNSTVGNTVSTEPPKGDTP